MSLYVDIYILYFPPEVYFLSKFVSNYRRRRLVYRD